jgi:hypothetical protein
MILIYKCQMFDRTSPWSWNGPNFEFRQKEIFEKISKSFIKKKFYFDVFSSPKLKNVFKIKSFFLGSDQRRKGQNLSFQSFIAPIHRHGIKL